MIVNLASPEKLNDGYFAREAGRLGKILAGQLLSFVVLNHKIP